MGSWYQRKNIKMNTAMDKYPILAWSKGCRGRKFFLVASYSSNGISEASVCLLHVYDILLAYLGWGVHDV